MKITEVWADTGEEVLRDATTEEIAAIEKIHADEEVIKADLEAKATAKASAQEKLAALGLTADEIAALA